MAVLKADALACPRGFAEPHFIRAHKPLETLEFREPYRIRRVQSSGENRAIRRRTGGPCRLEVRNPNQKSLPVLGSIANTFAQRTGGCGEAGGAREIRTVGAIYLCLSARPDHNRVITSQPTRPVLRCDFPSAASTTLPRTTFQVLIRTAKNPRKRFVFKGLMTGCGDRI
jgi:hypothetical protein